MENKNNVEGVTHKKNRLIVQCNRTEVPETNQVTNMNFYKYVGNIHWRNS